MVKENVNMVMIIMNVENVKDQEYINQKKDVINVMVQVNLLYHVINVFQVDE